MFAVSAIPDGFWIENHFLPEQLLHPKQFVKDGNYGMAFCLTIVSPNKKNLGGVILAIAYTTL